MNTIDDTRNLSWLKPILTLVAIGFFLTACGLVGYRAYLKQSVPGEIVDARYDENSAFRDFHNAIYFPVRAFLTGENPYSQEYLDYHPDGLGFPAFYPSTLLLHAPFGFFQVEFAQWIFFAFNLLLLVFVVHLSLKYVGRSQNIALVFGLAGFFLLTRPGVLNFYGVQLTLLHVLGCLLAIEHGRNRPGLAALGLLLASCKPTFTIPLAILMFFRGDWRAVVLGTILSLGVGGLAVGIIAQNNGGLQVFAEQVEAAYFSADGQPEIPEVVTSWTRIDAYSVLPRWELIQPDGKWELAILAAVILLGGVFIAMETDERQVLDSSGRFGVLAALAILISVYHQPYDALLLLLPLIALIYRSRDLVPVCGPILKWTLILLIGFPMVNYAGTFIVLDRLDIEQGSLEWQVLVTANAISLLAAFVLIGIRMTLSRIGWGEEY